MGTSGSYGGSGNADWKHTHDAFDALPVSGTGTQTPPDPAEGQQQLLDNILDALSTALHNDDADHGRPPTSGYPLSALLASSRGGSRGGSGGAGGGTRTPTGRAGAGSRRQVIKGSARGAAALAGAYALRNGDAARLQELGLDLAELRTLRPFAQISRILQTVLGDAGHPDEAALRKAATRYVKAVLLDPEPPPQQDGLRGLVTEWIYELALVELGSEKAQGNLTAQEAITKQRMIRSWLERRLKKIGVPDTRRMTVQEFCATAAKVTGEALRMLRARRS
ncbi:MULTISPECIES: hypothetical protein [Streptomyces griseus group]|uniref:hypothetical protein n=1 Tax=Streptomyces griseus group TaxID=629295 RepID=UPI002E14A0F4|nr:MULTISPECIES: hypothetical protein [Streptomyces griseus group]WSI46081.1 hypothetical protein OG366_00435 [Streptomyces cyaneofuscatus]WSI52666.1 hypothetical protein OG366_36730 [Streptomyces cyaneofuscatus]